MADCNKTPPNWTKIFEARPDLESPGYQETVRSLLDNKAGSGEEALKNKMKKIYKEKQSEKNKNRKPQKTKSVTPDCIDPLFSINKRRGDGR